MGLVATILVGLIAGVVAERIMGASYGLLSSIVLGIVGSVLANWLAMQLGINLPIANIYLNQAVLGIIGAVILIFGFRLIRS